MASDQIQSQPFETVRELSSIFGRVLAFQNWEKLIRHPNSIYQTSLEF